MSTSKLYRSSAAGDATFAVRVNELETDLKEARFRIQQSEERYQHVANLVERLWDGEYGAAVQLSRVFNLTVPGRWTDLGLRFSDDPADISAKSSTSSLGCHSCCPSDSRSRSRPPTSKISPRSSSTIEDRKNYDTPPPKVLLPSRKFCSPDPVKLARPTTSSHSYTTSYSSSSSFIQPSSRASNHAERASSPALARYGTGGIASTTRSGPLLGAYSRDVVSPKQSSSKESLNGTRVPSHFLRNRGSYHSIPTINIVPRQTIPSEHIPSVIPSSSSSNYKGSTKLKTDARPRTTSNQWSTAAKSEFRSSSQSFINSSADPYKSRDFSVPDSEHRKPWGSSDFKSSFSSKYETNPSRSSPRCDSYQVDADYQKTMARVYERNHHHRTGNYDRYKVL
ncbi:hypothetical protein RvY_07422 [Ramazzottius varieornatus]|uniref:Uncharacterized protein n=1 Tax=Ramazzottius varieornatus TaxID=947166 RepID=A0A1D1V876_RAMVA|nr:hypothetical protein RvY_07422 [Ramazzottius varieornatus]